MRVEVLFAEPRSNDPQLNEYDTLGVLPAGGIFFSTVTMPPPSNTLKQCPGGTAEILC
jgi:hypothetical protein